MEHHNMQEVAKVVGGICGIKFTNDDVHRKQ